MRTTSPTAMARLFALTFALAGVAGFVPNPLIGAEGLFVTNGAHNFVHLATAALFLAVSMRGDGASVRFTQIFGVVYLLVGVVGVVALAGSSEGMLLGLVHLNRLDNYLHLGLGAAIAGAGFVYLRPRVTA